MKVSRSLLSVLVMISLAATRAPAQMDVPANGSAGALVRSGGSCVRLSALMKAEGLEIRLPEGNRQAFYFRGAQVDKFPEPIKLSISASANCTDDPLYPSFAWPEFAEHLHFSFAWDTSVETNQSHLVTVNPTQNDAMSPPWREGASSKEFWFTIPAKGIPIGSKLKIEVFSGAMLLKSFSVQIGWGLQN
jgi:hypothetical protein